MALELSDDAKSHVWSGTAQLSNRFQRSVDRPRILEGRQKADEISQFNGSRNQDIKSGP